ncbi:MAG TPA: ATP12 family protein [Hyphomicrobiaceae bacterium]|nr:ATP12 family protein [Hyphomicrobiaceae bacterium]
MTRPEEPQHKRPALPKRFYRTVAVEAVPPLFRVLLDGKPAGTPARKELALPSEALAEAVAAEWEAQREHIDPATMPLTRLVNSGLDGIAGREAEVRADIAKYADNDLICYRAETPAGLVRRQTEAWDPVLAWAHVALGTRFILAQGVIPVAQPAGAIEAVERTLTGHDPLSLAAYHVMTTLTGSALLALAHGAGHLTAEEAWSAAHIDEDWEISQWGEDGEAKARRAHRWSEMQAASRLLALLAA